MSSSRVGKRRDARNKAAIYQHGFREGREEAAAEITRLRAEVAHWQRQAEAAQNNATLFQQDCAFHVAEKARKDEALKPFDALLDIFQQGSPSRPSKGQIHAWVNHSIGERELTVEMLEAARAARMPAEGRAALEQEGAP